MTQLNFTSETHLFRTESTQQVFDQWIDLVLSGIVETKGIIEAKGLFTVEGKTKYVGYDQPYHIHILQGIMPALNLLERLAESNDWKSRDDYQQIIKTFILGFTFHDANKLMDIEDLGEAISHLADSGFLNDIKAYDFFPELDDYWGDIEELVLYAENRTSLQALGKATKLPKALLEELNPLVRFADEIASAGGADIYEWKDNAWLLKNTMKDSLQSIQDFYAFFKEKLVNLIPDAPEVSFIKMQRNPFRLVSDQIMKVTANYLEEKGMHTFSFMRDGFLYWGNPLNSDDLQEIENRLSGESRKSVDPVKLTKVDFQSCKLGFIGSIPFDLEVWEDILSSVSDNFLHMAPNGVDKLGEIGISQLIDFIEKLTEAYNLPLLTPELNDQGKLYIRFDHDNIKGEDDNQNFVRLFSIFKAKWLNGKANKAWENNFKSLIKSDEAFYEDFEWKVTDDIVITSPKALNDHFDAMVAGTTGSLLKNLLALMETYKILTEEGEDAIEDHFDELKSVLDKTKADSQASSPIITVFKEYFDYSDNSFSKDWINQIAPLPSSADMCLFTGKKATKKYEQTNAFGLGSRGFSRRSKSTLSNKQSYISDLADAENKARLNYSTRPKANTAIYMDFCESFGGSVIDWGLFRKLSGIRGYTVNDDNTVNINKSAQLNSTKFSLDLTEVAKDMKNQLFLVRNQLDIARKTGARTYVTSIMGEYRPHKEIFVYDQAPAFIRQLGWDRVHLTNLENEFDEIALSMELFKQGRGMDSGLILKYAQNRNSIFQAYYQYAHADESKARGMKSRIINFISENPKKFNHMTTIEKLAEIATRIRRENKNFNQESELFRLALEVMQKELRFKPSKEDMIQRIAGELYKKERLNFMGADKTQACDDFAQAMYEDLYEKEWNGQFPSKDRERTFLYQFAFVYSKKVTEFYSNSENRKADKEVLETV
ncbi:hypothetical protein [Aureibacter tunicatorum]|uniref:Uncharacterized protein n=1 Tax=Aureibacter tunicatorum TaxID=866807 RepID=A0AAE3XUH6_9BACT|nr:hypothetical protein [Aureibacter tunicatorum]MDR6241939.1 hypothetical protein [Aureibacter tunicatorum]BDD07545.1 hypothetical protein AUTU_50280 [Aureibacter tunicatorum]